MREYTTQLLQLVETGVLNANEVLHNVIGNYMSEDDVKDFCLTEYTELFEEEEQ